MAITTEPLLLQSNDQTKLAAAVEAAERRTAVEFHVRVEATSRDPDERAYELFGVAAARSRRRHCVLLYLAAHDRRWFVVTDEALRPLASTRVWRDVGNRLTLDLLHGKAGDGLADAIGRFSHIVAGHFPGVAGVQTRSIAR